MERALRKARNKSKRIKKVTRKKFPPINKIRIIVDKYIKWYNEFEKLYYISDKEGQVNYHGG